MRDVSVVTACNNAVFSVIKAFSACLLASSALLAPQAAQARSEALEWTQPGEDVTVSAYAIRYGQSPNALAHHTRILVEDADRGSDGSFRYELQVPEDLEDEDLWITVQAMEMDEARNVLAVSPWSNTIQRAASARPAPDPDPTPQPPPGNSGGGSTGGGSQGGDPDPDGPLGAPGRPTLVLD